jgi:hypothetical protein
MQQNQCTQTARAKVWAALTLAVAVTTSSAIAIANAQGSGRHAVRPDKVKNCSGSGACIGGTNSCAGPGVEGNATTFYGVLGPASGANAGVGGYISATSSGASGVYGQSENGYGVYGFSEAASGYGLASQGNAFVSGEIFTGFGLAALRKEEGRTAEAPALYERALTIKELAFAADPPELGEIRTTIDALRARLTCT